MTCKDCIHKKACDSWHGMGDAQYNEWSSMENIETICVNFQNKADLQNVKHGEWKHTTEPMGWNDVDCFECSICGESWCCNEDLSFEEQVEGLNYCPHCGARMDRSDEQ